MKNLVLLSLSLFFFACNGGGGGSNAVKIDSSGYMTTAIPGTNAKKAVKMDATGNLIEEGILIDDMQTGAWITYHPNSNFPMTIANFVNGQYNGLYMELTERGQISVRSTYKNNKLDGLYGKYKFGKVEEEATYKEGELHGTYKKYTANVGKLQTEQNYKDGKLHGVLKYYNQDGRVTMEYEYKNGEKVSGGIVDPQEVNEPK
ncbi:MAG: hypothetical protein GY705_23535 [Bacteroidetes bacterium]|nr:hypothetical protein [Bacteroidota bacterium]